MTSKFLLVAAHILSLLVARDLSGQDSSQIGDLEVKAVQTMLARRVLPAGTIIAINPMIVAYGVAPGGGEVERRPTWRASILTTTLGGAIEKERESIVQCDASKRTPCTLKEVDIFVSLSEPIVDANRAVVTVTLESKSKRGTAYETVNIEFIRQAGSWTVARVTQIGIS